jgi:hypothetical protein
MKKVFAIMVAAAFAVNGLAQECGVYHPTKVGTVLTYTYYEKPDKAGKTCEMTLKNKENTAKGLKLDVDGVVKEKNGSEALKYSYTAWCDGATFFIDMKSMLSTINAGNISQYKIESKDLQFPKDLSVGQKLPDASLTLTIEGPISTGVTSVITNRKVEALESITTSAGTFDCVKISYDYNSKVMFIKTSGKAIEWYALNVGMVKTETYNAKGKLVGTNLLTSLK